MKKETKNLKNAGRKSLNDSVIDSAQKRFLVIFEKNNGLVYLSCKKFGMSAVTYYNWYNRNKLFATACDDINEKVIDEVENRLMEHIRNKDNEQVSSSATKYYLSTKGHKRGYKERIEHTVIDWTNLTLEQLKYIEIHGELPKDIESA